MTIYRTTGEVPKDFGPSVVTVGNFDGVHCGHRAVIAQVIRNAGERGARSVVVTFHPHPACFLRPDIAPKLITPLEYKLELLAATGVDAVLVLPFDQEFAAMSARGFAELVLRDTLRAVEVHEGENFRFGRGAEAGVEGLTSLGTECDFSVRCFEPLLMHGDAVSSTRVRALIASGAMGRARHMLGRPFAVDSTPARGRGYGSKYAVPTINLAEYRELLPGNGVYITRTRVGVGVEAREFDGVTNIGNRPTFGADSFAVESHLFRFEPVDVNEATPVRLTFLKRLRDEQKFESVEALKAQIGRDVARAERWFGLERVLRGSRAA